MAEPDIRFEIYAAKEYVCDFLTACNFFVKHNNAFIIPILTYITALIVCQNTSCLRAAKEILGVSHDTILNSIGAAWYDASPILLGMVSSLAPKIGNRGWLIIDDVIIHKPHSKRTAYAFKIMDHSSNTYIWGINVVVLLWSNGLYRSHWDTKYMQTRNSQRHRVSP